MKIFLSFLLLALLAGCASTNHVQMGVNELDRSSHSVIIADTDRSHGIFSGLDYRMYFVSLDDEDLFDIRRNEFYPETLSVTPGVHKVVVQLAYRNWRAYGCLLMDSEAGKSYIVKREIGSYSVRFWGEDINGGDPVGVPCE